MNPQPQPENFERLQKLLALKRHEQPPPGYFDKLSSRIADCIQHEKELQALPWWRRLGVNFEFKPAFVCVAGVVLCGLFSAGVISALQVDGNGVPQAATPSDQFVIQQSVAESGMPPMPPQEVQSSIEPVLTTTSGTSPFEPPSLRVQRVGYSFGN